ncbi:MAG: hypothetical protein ACI8RZ_004176 [Myxococcota bacterium]|jgi:hypothetical protein
MTTDRYVCLSCHKGHDVVPESVIRADGHVWSCGDKNVA